MTNTKHHSKKRGQLQSGETIVVIIIVIIMLMVGLVFFTNSKKSTATAEAKSLSDVNAMKIAVVASGLNELKCSDYNVMVKTCFDYYRLKAFRDIVDADTQKSKEYYYFVFRNSLITLRIIMPNATIENIVLYNYNNTANKSSTPTFIPVIVNNPMTKENYFSILEVRTYS